MTERLVIEANDAAENADARAPLSSYLRDGTLTDSQDGWTIISSDDESNPERTPNLSVLKQIKSFLNSKSGESDVPFDSSARRFRVDYPYYAPETEDESSASNCDEKTSSQSSVPNESSDKTDSNIAEITPQPIPSDQIVSTSGNDNKISADKSDVLIHSKDDESKSTSDEGTMGESGKKRIETVVSPTIDRVRLKENNVLVCSLSAPETTDETSVRKSTTQKPILLDVAEISGVNFSDAPLPTVDMAIEEESESPKTISEKQSVSSTELKSTRNFQSVESFGKPREGTSSIRDNASKMIARRKNSDGKLSIFRRFVDLATKRNKMNLNEHNLTDHHLNRKESVDTLLQDDYSHEICICDAYESANSTEVVVAPCYVGANMTFQY